MAKARSAACYLLAALLLGTLTVADSAAKSAHRQHTPPRGRDETPLAQNASPSVSGSASHYDGGDGAAKPENEAPSAPAKNDDGTVTVDPNAGPHQNLDGREGKQGRPPSSNAAAATTGSPGKDANPPDVPINDLGAVDTRITVQPRLHGSIGHSDGEQKDKNQPHALTSLGSHPRLSPRHQDEIIHNAIGVPIPRSASAPAGGQGSDSRAASPTAPPPVSNTVVIPPRVTVLRPHRGTLTPAPASRPPTISGNGLHRRGNAPATLGGPTMTAAGINGSTIRPTR